MAKPKTIEHEIHLDDDCWKFLHLIKGGGGYQWAFCAGITSDWFDTGSTKEAVLIISPEQYDDCPRFTREEVESAYWGLHILDLPFAKALEDAMNGLGVDAVTCWLEVEA